MFCRCEISFNLLKQQILFRKTMEMPQKFSDDEIEHSVFIAKSIDEIIDSAYKINKAINIINSGSDDSAVFAIDDNAVVPAN